MSADRTRETEPAVVLLQCKATVTVSFVVEAPLKGQYRGQPGRCLIAAMGGTTMAHTALSSRGTRRPSSRSCTCGSWNALCSGGAAWFNGLERAILSLAQHPKRTG